jgi:TolB protein
MRLLSSAAFAFLGLFLSTHPLLIARAQDVSHGEGSQAAPSQAAPSQAARSHGTIAYTNGREIRLIESDGSGDRVVWMVPDTAYSISRLAWSPDGEEIAFASDHEMATSFYERDIFGIRPDGTGVRKLTNPPVYQELASFAKGTVTVTVSNYSGDGGPFFVYVSGAAAPQQVSIGPGASRNLEFTDVADFGEDVFQHVVVISGIFRWWDAAVAADVEAGTTVNAGTINMTSAFEHYGADGPFWRSDGSTIGFFQTAGVAGTSTCILEQIPVPPPFGFYSDPIFDPEWFETPCAVDWAPLPALADEMLVTDYTDYVENGEVHVYRISEGSEEKGEPVVTFDEYVQIYDIRWLPDGSGFLVARHDGLLETGLNLYEYEFESGSLTRITDFAGEEEGVRSFSISPDGQFVVFEYVANADDQIGDLWIMRRDGTDQSLLVSNGRLLTGMPRIRTSA